MSPIFLAGLLGQRSGRALLIATFSGWFLLFALYKELLVNGCRILIGFMLPSWFLSMWLSNTATTGMMIPVAEKVIDEMWTQQRNRRPSTAVSYTAIHGIG